ncbi:MAG: hldE [Chlamydiales bacterium]|jgi:D-beta-D-heptose 7-phosphate kinase/D-beta-D-heptose 1-phosphate adenosyltransferase|nr:hldE [Chlamydiales bacterium]
MVRLASSFSRIEPSHILVAGDLMVDAYTFGTAKRISPEAPVPIVQVERYSQQPGGAGNVALNIQSLLGEVTLLGRVGQDLTGAALIEQLKNASIHTQWIVQEKGYPTPLKNRLIVENQQIVRIDQEKLAPLSLELETELIEQLDALLEPIRLIAISDYGKGFLSDRLLQALIQKARSLGIAVIVDPKGIAWQKYRGCSLIKPNASEAYAFAQVERSEPLSQVAANIFSLVELPQLLITQADQGSSLFAKSGEMLHFPVESRQVKDVTGAGDTVLATLAIALASGITLPEAIELSNVAAGIAIEHVGCWHVTLPELAQRLLQLDTANKVFGEEHLFTLKHALSGQAFNLLSLKTNSSVSLKLFESIHRLSQKQLPLILYILDEPEEHLLNVLTQLKDVAFVICHSPKMTHLTSHLPIQESYLFQDEELHLC